jgi:NAD(P)-dependent dehydrogenase (short-subunit alcohol dehydrogenase family)
MSKQRTWLVTGTSRGLGRSIAEAVLEAGDNVVATARDREQLKDLVLEYGKRITSVSLDVTDAEGARDAVQAAVRSFGGLDVLVNNAGYADVGSVEDMTDEAFRAQIETNFFGVVHLTKAALPIMRVKGSGHIIQVSSVGGRVGGAGLGAYQAAKWAVGGFSEVLAKEVACFGIKVTVAEPGGMRTNWAGSSMATLTTSDAYKPVIEPVVERLRGADENQPGDPKRIAQVLIDVVAMREPPLRLLLGHDAVAIASMTAEKLAESDARWRSLSESISYPA